MPFRSVRVFVPNLVIKKSRLEIKNERESHGRTVFVHEVSLCVALCLSRTPRSHSAVPARPAPKSRSATRSPTIVRDVGKDTILKSPPLVKPGPTSVLPAPAAHPLRSVSAPLRDTPTETPALQLIHFAHSDWSESPRGWDYTLSRTG